MRRFWKDLKSGIYECRLDWYGGPYWRGMAIFPIWFAELPCLIAPLLCLRRWRVRRRSAIQAGFAVIAGTGSKSASDSVG